MKEKLTAVDCAVVTAVLMVTEVPDTAVTYVLDPGLMPGPDTAIPGVIALLEAAKVMVVLELVAEAATAVSYTHLTLPTILRV